MRFLWAGLLLFSLSSAAWGQAKGQVLSIGFNNHYRPDAWTPMLVQLSSESDSATAYQIQVVQEDLDRDKVHYVKMETLGGNIEGKPSTTENFWVYFRPQPTNNGGLPDASGGHTLAELSKDLKVFLCDQKGKQICLLPLTSTILSDDMGKAGGQTRSRRLILFVSDGNDRPILPDFLQQRGILEEVDPVLVKPSELPDNVIGYEGVDAMVWLDADATFLTSGTRTPSLEAIGQWVRQGGNLVICQPPETNKIRPFVKMDLMPVGEMINGEWAIPMQDRTDSSTLRRLAKVDTGGYSPWPRNLGTYKVARVPAAPGTKVDEWIDWTDGGKTTYTPWLARRAVGLGAVTWVAQNLGDRALTAGAHIGWRYIWERVFGWNDDPNVPEVYTPPTDRPDPWEPGAGMDVGKSLFTATMELSNTAVKLEAIAVLFFIFYGLAAGPGSYFFLLAKKREHQSWFYFALAALVGTGLTVVLVRLVVRGPPQLKHISIVRAAAGEADGVIDTRLGLYIPQDGDQTIALKQTADHQVSFVTPFAIHPDYFEDANAISSYEEYNVPVRDPTNVDQPAITVHYHSSSKKLEAKWIGPVSAKIDEGLTPGNAKLVPPGDNGYINGILINHSGYDLAGVYLAYQQPPVERLNEESANDDTMLMYCGAWAKDSALDLSKLTARGNRIGLPGAGVPGGKTYVFGTVTHASYWDDYWQQNKNNLTDDVKVSLPLLTIFDRIPPWQRDRNAANGLNPRNDLLRRSARSLDLVPAIEAGKLVVVGIASINGDTDKTPLPIPMTVNDSPVDGPGMVIFQFVLPLDRGGEDNPPQPATQPTTGP